MEMLPGNQTDGGFAYPVLGWRGDLLRIGAGSRVVRIVVGR
jgi:hypothetical protein